MFNVLRYRTFSGIWFLFVLAAAVSGYIYRGGFRYSVDFTGGTQVLLRFSEGTTSAAVKDALEGASYRGVTIREFSKNEMAVRVQEFEADATGMGERIKSVLEKSLNQSVEIRSIESVGSGVGKELRTKSIKAILFGLLAMLIYLALRFQFAFSVGAIVALINDALVILAVFLWFNLEISIDVIGAIMATLGYSVNDTIVIFSQIRRNMSKIKDKSLADIVNISTYQTLRRTLLTSFATSLVVVSLLVFGGESLRHLSFALLLGIIFGTFSSIFIASPVMLMLHGNTKES